MSLKESVEQVIQKFEKSASKQQLKQVEEVHECFEKMVAAGLVSRPTYNLESISTLPVKIILPITSFNG